MSQEGQLILNRYRAIAQAGVGGYGTVQLAWDTRIQRRVAIKCMELPDAAIFAGFVADDPDNPQAAPTYDAARLPGLDEARTAAMLSDPNIVGVYDFEVQGATAYLIMEYVDGITLTRFLSDFGDRMDADILAAVFGSVAHALEVAHENQVLHLDVKPDNILINRQGQVKVTDFGLAKLADATGYGAAAGGTIGYMPLEQMRLEPLDARCDEWALASLTYEMIAGGNPFFADDLNSAQTRITDAELVLPSLCMPGLDPQVDDVLFYAMDPNREERYDNVQDFAEELLPFFGSPAKGAKCLRALVAIACGDEEEVSRDDADTTTIFDRVSIGSRRTLERCWSAFNCAVLGFVSLANIDALGGFTGLPLWGLLALVVLAGALVPRLGSLLAVGTLAAALLFNGAFIPGAALLVAGAVWWFFVGRWTNMASCCALSPALFGAVDFAGVVPLLCGFTLRVVPALCCAAFACLVAFLLAGFGTLTLAGWQPLAFWQFSSTDINANYLVLLQNPVLWIQTVSWVVSAAVLSLFCVRSNRGLAFLGALLAGGVEIFGVCLGAYMASGMVSWMPDTMPLILAIVATICVCLLCVLGVPVRDDDSEES